VKEVEAEQTRRVGAGGTTSSTLPNGMREVRINYHELEAE
jgi:hypothetical protein